MNYRRLLHGIANIIEVKKNYMTVQFIRTGLIIRIATATSTSTAEPVDINKID